MSGSEPRPSRSSAPQERALLERVLDGAPIGIIVLDRGLRFLRVNTRAAAMFGIDERGSAGLGLAEVLPALATELKNILQDVLSGGASHVAIETSTPRLTPDTPGLYLAYYYPLRGEDNSVMAWAACSPRSPSSAPLRLRCGSRGGSS